MAYFNPFRPSYLRDPYPSLARLREDDPVHYSKQMQAWVVTRYADCVEVLRDQQHYSSNPRSAGGAWRGWWKRRAAGRRWAIRR